MSDNEMNDDTQQGNNKESDGGAATEKKPLPAQLANLAIDLEERRNAKKAKTTKQKDDDDKSPKSTFSQFTQYLVEIIDGKAPHELIAGPFPTKFHTLRTASGTKLVVVETSPGIIRPAFDGEFEDTLACYIKSRLEAFREIYPKVPLSTMSLKEVIQEWTRTNVPIDSPPAIVHYGDPSLAFARLPWPILAEPQLQNCPTWLSILDRLTNWEAFCHWIGSLFVRESNHHQYAWVYGKGHDGKGTMAKFFSRVMGTGAWSGQPPAFQERFWLTNIIGKRLMVFSDCENRGFVTSGLFKSLTGGDILSIEAKFKAPIQYLPAARYLVFSNKTPRVADELSDRRRLILCEFTRPGLQDPDFEEKLWREGQEFISCCVVDYLSAYPQHGPMGSNTEGLDRIIELNEADFQGLFDRIFEPNGITVKDLHGKPESYALTKSIRNKDLTERLRWDIPNKKERDDFREWMIEKGLLQDVQVRCSDARIRVYLGASFLPRR